MRETGTDPITPSQIEHRIDEVWCGKTLEQRYNYLDYHFESKDGYCRARAYLDDMQTAHLFGPFERRGSIGKVTAPELEDAVRAYLRRRFLMIDHL